MAIYLFVDKSKNEFSLAPAVARIDNLGNVAALHKVFEYGKLLLLAAAGGGAFYYFKIMKPKKDAAKGSSNLDDLDFDEDDEEELETEQEDEEV